jgi:hypothetical protein
MNRPPLYAALSLALLALGCGGSSTGSSSTTSVSLSNLSTPQIEAVLTTAGATGVTSLPNPVVEDARDIQIGDIIQFELVAYDSSGGRHVLAGTGWSKNLSSQYGALNSVTGQFTTTQTAMPNIDAIGVTYNNTLYTASYQVQPQEPRLIGQIVSSSGGAAVPGVEVDFFNSSGIQVGAASTAYDGTFRASVPSSAVSFTLNSSTITGAYWQSFAYGFGGTTFQYDAGSTTCYAPLSYYPVTWTGIQPTSTAASTTSLPTSASSLFLAPAGTSAFAQVLPLSSSDPGIIVLAARVGNATKPQSSGCSG